MLLTTNSGTSRLQLFSLGGLRPLDPQVANSCGWLQLLTNLYI